MARISAVVLIPLLAAWVPKVAAVPVYGLLAYSLSESQNETLFFGELARQYTPANARPKSCPRAWWDVSGFGSSVTPTAYSSQQCGYFDATYAALGGSIECIEQDETPLAYAGPAGPWSSWTGPLALNLEGFSASSGAARVDDSIESGDVTPMLTPISGSAAVRELKRAWRNAKHKAPSEDAILILAAHWAHETHGGRSMFNFNFGGIKGHGSDGRSCVREAHEGAGYHVRALLDRFRAYESAREGADDYLSLLIRRYPAAIEAVERGDVTDFVAQLRSGGYFTGSELDYARSLSALVARASERGFDALSSDGN